MEGIEKIRRLHTAFDVDTWPLRDNVAWLRHQCKFQHTQIGLLLEMIDQLKRVSCSHGHWSMEKYGRVCTCGAMMVDFGD